MGTTRQGMLVACVFIRETDDLRFHIDRLNMGVNPFGATFNSVDERTIARVYILFCFVFAVSEASSKMCSAISQNTLFTAIYR